MAGLESLDTSSTQDLEDMQIKEYKILQYNSLDSECDGDDDGEDDEARQDRYRHQLVGPAVDAAELHMGQVLVVSGVPERLNAQLEQWQHFGRRTLPRIIAK